MRALFYAIGTRGDAEPFLALAELLKNYGWEVTCVFPEQFRSMAEQVDIPFYGFDERFLEILQETSSKTIMGGSGSFWTKIKSFIRLIQSSWGLQDKFLQTQINVIDEFAPDLIFYHPKCTYPVLHEILHPNSTILVCPIPCVVHEVKEYTTMGLKGNGDYGKFLNSMSYKLANWIRALVFYKMTRKYRKSISKKPITVKSIYDTIVNKTKSFYSVSPSLFPRPSYWPKHVHVTGFLERSKSIHWEPSRELSDFLSRHEKILFVTFGSMTNHNPQLKTRQITDVIEKHDIPAIINTSWGGLQEPESHSPNIFFVNNIPYPWIFPKMYAIIHHGGSGTTHTACKYGCPSLIIPHIVDQYFWNKRIASMGLGPKGIAINKLGRINIEHLIVDLWKNNNYKIRAKEIQQMMKQEADHENVLRLL